MEKDRNHIYVMKMTQHFLMEKDRKHIAQMYDVLGKMPREMALDCEFSEDIFTDLLLKIVKNKSEYNNKKESLKKLNYQNSWNDINHKINKIIDEN